MSEGISATEVGREIGKHADEHRHAHRDRVVTIVEGGRAVGRHAARRLVRVLRGEVGHGVPAQAGAGVDGACEVESAFQESLTFRVGDATTFNAWFGAYLTGDENDMRVAEKRFRPQFRSAFGAWIATHPFTNPNAPAGPQSMPQYKPENR